MKANWTTPNHEDDQQLILDGLIDDGVTVVAILVLDGDYEYNYLGLFNAHKITKSEILERLDNLDSPTSLIVLPLAGSRLFEFDITRKMVCDI